MLHRRTFAAAAALLLAVAAFECAKNDTASILACDEGQVQCGAGCTNVKIDGDNCGKCDVRCASGQACVDGKCSSACPAGNTMCAPDGGGASSCVNTKSDNKNCGKCGYACPQGQVCWQGGCSSTCGGNTSGQTLCADAGYAYCAALMTDNDNCGKCGMKCAPTQVCASGVCQSSCNMDQTLCADGGAPYCAHLQSDNANCGTCGTKCGVLEACTMGVCVPQCAWNQKMCTQDGGVPYCVDHLTDNKNCGTCGNVCPPQTPVCQAGQCKSGGQPPTCVPANGLVWCYNSQACGQPCNQVCGAMGMTPVNTSTWFNAQNTTALCQNISNAFGLGNSVSMASYTYACVEDTWGNHTAPGGIFSPLLCSTYAQCPQNHLTNMDQNGVNCGPNSRRSICPCQ